MAVALQSDAFTKADIASLTPADIAKMTFDQMVEIVVASEIVAPGLDRIRDFEGETLVRLVYSARSHCRAS